MSALTVVNSVDCTTTSLWSSGRLSTPVMMSLRRVTAVLRSPDTSDFAWGAELGGTVDALPGGGEGATSTAVKLATCQVPWQNEQEKQGATNFRWETIPGIRNRVAIQNSVLCGAILSSYLRGPTKQRRSNDNQKIKKLLRCLVWNFGSEVTFAS